MFIRLSFLLLLVVLVACREPESVEAEQWATVELLLYSENEYGNPYTDTDVWAWFVGANGDSLLRPAFWDGGKTWKVRFAPPDNDNIWTWTTYCTNNDAGLAGKTGKVRSTAYRGDSDLLRHGLLGISAGKRNVVHADGTPFLVVGDTPWSIPFRATPAQVEIYANDRREKGFNSALLLSLQPDRYAQGSEERNTQGGFDRAFEDLSEGRLDNLKPDYFQQLDTLIQILLANELVPVIAPFAHGYGWKGETAIGPQASQEAYVRYCKYLVARYGSNPAMWLINLDGNPLLSPGVKPAGEALQKWDAYSQPVGLHYSPFDDWLATWAKGDSTCCFHYNKTYQSEEWLDFQWAQTGHDGKHLYHKVERMYPNQPTKAVMNGESTYEGMGDGKQGLGWWQGEDAWMQLMHGGTMGVVYGAVGLWQWKITADEPGWPEWTNAPVSWREALEFEGAQYVGSISRAFEGFNFADMERRWDLTADNKPLLAKEGVFYVSYLDKGGEIRIKNVPDGMTYHWFNPVTGKFQSEGKSSPEGLFTAPDNKPWVLVVGEKNI